MNESIKEYYVNNFPSDELGQDIDEKVTFWDLFEALDVHKDVYDLLGVRDSIIRERVFSRLAELIEAPYNYVYEQWLAV